MVAARRFLTAESWCYQVPCDRGYTCDAVSGDCVRDGMHRQPAEPSTYETYDRPSGLRAYR